MKQEWIKTEDEIRRLRLSGQRLAEIMVQLEDAVRPGITTGALGVLAETLIKRAGGDPIFRGYGKDWGAPPFPAVVCLSLDDEVVHGIPLFERTLVSGQLLKIDIGMRLEGMVSDMARTIGVGELSPQSGAIRSAVQEALAAGVTTLRSGSTMEEYAMAVETTAKKSGFACVRDLVGHGVGRELHEDPQIPNYAGSRLPAFQFKTGMTVALEPMINAGSYQVRLADDGWTFVTADGKLSAHWEDTVLITENGAEVLTRIPG